MNVMVASTFDRTDKKGWAEWNLIHMVTHQQVFDAVMDLGQALTYYPLDYDKESDDWKQNHQDVHTALNNYLQLDTGIDNLVDVDFDDEAQFRNWMYYHALAHQQINEALGL